MILTSLSPVQCAKSCAGCSRRHGYPAPSKTAGLRQCYEVIALVSGAVPQALHCLDLKPGKLPEDQGPPGSTGTSGGGRTAPSHARNSSTSGGSNHRSPTCSSSQTSCQHGS